MTFDKLYNLKHDETAVGEVRSLLKMQERGSKHRQIHDIDTFQKH